MDSLALPETGTVTVINRNPFPLNLNGKIARPHQPLEVPSAYVGMFGGTQGLEWDFTAFSEHLRSHTEDGRPYIDFWCPLSIVDGFGRHALDVARGLRELGVEVALRRTGYQDDTHLPTDLVQESNRNLGKAPSKVSVVFSVPGDPDLTRSSSVTRIGITQFETDHVPQKYVERVNRLDHLILGAAFQPAIWKRSGTKIPMDVMTPGVDTDLFNYYERPMDGTFKVLVLGALTPRKNPLEALRIFQEASRGNPDWRLTIKTRGHLDKAREIWEAARRDRRITVLFQNLPPAAIPTLYHQHNALLWPSKGEGTGLPPLEAMSTGMEVVAPDHSGLADFMGKRHSWPIRTAGLIPASGPGETWSADWVAEWGDVGNYWLPDHGDAVKQLERCFNAWREGKGRGRAAAQYVRENHTLRHQAESVLRVVERYL